MQGRCDGLGWSTAAEHMALQHAGVFITGHKGKVPKEDQKIGVNTHHSDFYEALNVHTHFIYLISHMQLFMVMKTMVKDQKV